MPPKIALILSLVCSCWLLRRDVKRRPEVSSVLWIPLLWLIFISSRPLSMWLNGGAPGADYSEGNLIDRLGNLLLIVTGCTILFRRQVGLGRILSSNKWLVVFFGYWGLSLFWSSYSIPASKEYIKDLGNLVMVLLVLSEENVIGAAKALFARCAYVLIPLSIVFIKYFPDLGRGFNPWSWEYMYVGVTLQKNSLGSLALLCMLFFLWDFVFAVKENVKVVDRRERIARWLLFGMCIWLLDMSNSATSLICAILGTALLLVLRTQFFRRNPKVVALYVIGAAAAFLVFDGLFSLREFLVTSVGRDMTLTTRTSLWTLVLEQDINPVLGAGFYSFWRGTRLEAIWEFYEGINQAHNGYLETYLNGGIVAVCLLVAWVSAASRSIYNDLGTDFGKMRFVILVVVLVYNFSEAAFNRFTPVWLAFLLVTVKYPQRVTARPTEAGPSIPKGEMELVTASHVATR